MIWIDISKPIEDQLREGLGDDLSKAAKEALAIEAYRTGSLSVGEVGEMLAMGAAEAQEWLGRRGVPMNYSFEDLRNDREALSQLFPESGG